MLFLDSGLWSGFRRQMELAESFGQPMITVNGPHSFNITTYS